MLQLSQLLYKKDVTAVLRDTQLGIPALTLT